MKIYQKFKDLIKRILYAPKRIRIENNRAKFYNSWLQEIEGRYLYYGNLGISEHQFKFKKFLGLALYPTHEREIKHDAMTPLPFPAESITKIQSQDVFEHLAMDSIPFIFDEIFRVMAKGAIFRLSVPDYRSNLLRQRSIYDCNGKILGDLMMGASAHYNSSSGAVEINFIKDGNAHIWFPTYELIQDLISRSSIKNCQTIKFRQCFLNDKEFICEALPDDELFVMRSVPHDMRAGGKPVSIVVDFHK
jgi:hypothetical protein